MIARIIMIMIGLIFILMGAARAFSTGPAFDSMFLISIFSGLLLIARGIKHRPRVRDREEADAGEDSADHKIYASGLFLKGRTEPQVRMALMKKGLSPGMIDKII